MDTAHIHLATAIAIVIAYLIGSVSSAVIVCKAMRLPDPRKVGSGNPGTTNVLRVGGRMPAIITLLGDVLKGVIPVLLAKAYGLTGVHLSCIALAAFFGHLYPVFFQFKGGKGVATGFGAILALCWPIAIAMFITWVVIAVVFRYSSLAAIIATLSGLAYNAWFGLTDYYPAFLIMAVFTLWRHKGNIQRLCQGLESRIGKKK